MQKFLFLFFFYRIGYIYIYIVFILKEVLYYVIYKNIAHMTCSSGKYVHVKTRQIKTNLFKPQSFVAISFLFCIHNQPKNYKKTHTTNIVGAPKWTIPQFLPITTIYKTLHHQYTYMHTYTHSCMHTYGHIRSMQDFLQGKKKKKFPFFSMQKLPSTGVVWV